LTRPLHSARHCPTERTAGPSCARHHQDPHGCGSGPPRSPLPFGNRCEHDALAPKLEKDRFAVKKAPKKTAETPVPTEPHVESPIQNMPFSNPKGHPTKGQRRTTSH